ncbi:MAG TPA: RNA polymerase sigma factor [Polyangiaceae bacterium]
MSPPSRSSSAERRRFEAAVGPLLGRLLGFLSRRVKSRSGEEEDLLQDAVLQAWREWETLRDHDAVRPWLFRICLRVLQEHMRKSARREQLIPVVDLEQRFVELIASPSPTSLELLIDRASSEEVWSALQRLPRELSLALELYEVEELSYREVAEALGLPIGTVMSRIHRARRHLAVILTAPRAECSQMDEEVERARR